MLDSTCDSLRLLVLAALIAAVPGVALAHGFGGGIQAQLGAGTRFAADDTAIDGGEIWANAAIYGMGVEAGVFYRHAHPDRSAGARFGFGLRPLALIAGTGVESGWKILDFPIQAAAMLGGIERPSPYVGLLTEVGVEIALPIADPHPAINCRLRWTAAEHPTTAGPTVFCGIGLRFAG